MVCMSVANDDGAWLYHVNPSMQPHGPLGTGVAPAQTAREVFEYLLEQDPVYGLYASYDLAVSLREWPELFPQVFKALDEGRFVDVMYSQQLVDNAHGEMKWRATTQGYSLNALEKRWLKTDRSQQKRGPNAWRLKYRQLVGIPLHLWPKEAVDYAIEDATGAKAIGDKQLASEDKKYLRDSPAQMRAGFALHLMMCWGSMTDPDKIELLKKYAEEKYWELSDALVMEGLVRGDSVSKNLRWTRDTKAAQRRMIEVCKAQGLTVKLTDTGFKKYYAMLEESGVDKKDWGNFPPDQLFTPDEILKYASLDEDACKESGDEVLIQYSLRSQLHSVVNTHVPDLLKGTRTPIQPRYSTLVESGRTSCSKSRSEDGKKAPSPTNGFQQQNPKRAFMWIPPGTKKSVHLFPSGVGIRECFVARPKKLLADNDFSGLELCTGAQVCVSTVGYSLLGDAINRGIDPHLDFAAAMMGITYAEAKSRKHEEIVKYHRQLAKVANFGLPGGLSVRGLVGFARGYGVKLSESDAKKLRDDWFEKYPEWRAYFRWVRDQLDPETNVGTFEQLFVGRYRGRCRFTEACNTMFQGLGADVAKNALYAVQKYCYVRQPGSTLYGVRPIAFIHDEILAEVDEELAHEQAFELAKVMVDEGNKLLPDVPVKCVPALSQYWCKEAEAVFDRNGRLQPYDLARAGNWESYYDQAANDRVPWKKAA